MNSIKHIHNIDIDNQYVDFSFSLPCRHRQQYATTNQSIFSQSYMDQSHGLEAILFHGADADFYEL